MKRTAADLKDGQIVVRNAQRKVGFDLRGLSDFALKAWTVCDSEGEAEWDVLPVSVVVVSDKSIADLHWKFMSVRGPTDVITFQHGEIVISAETARRQARQFGTDLMHELQLYLVHGLLHLRGFDDRTPRDAKRMAKRQERILRLIERGEKRNR